MKLRKLNKKRGRKRERERNGKGEWGKTGMKKKAQYKPEI
jgi:hypothetical protein